MVISIDYDDTWTLDPKGWQQIVTILRKRGHTVILITNRPNLPRYTYEVKREVARYVDDIIFAGITTPKRAAAASRGYGIDVWIDDYPSAVDHGR